MGRMRATVVIAMAVLAGCSSPATGGPDASPATDSGAPPDAGSADAGMDAGASPDGGSCPGPGGQDDAGTYTELRVVGDPGSASGIYDPSLFFPEDAGLGLMTYSSVPDQRAVLTRVAVSTDQGQTWTYVQDVNQVTPQTVSVPSADPSICGATTCTGHRIHEVSSLAVDVSDPNPAAHFKVLTHSYLVSDLPDGGFTLDRTVGVLSMYTTQSPSATAVWTETRLFGWNGVSPESSTNVMHNISTEPALSALSGCLALTEPGLLVRGAILDLAVQCETFDPVGSRIVTDVKLLRSFDHGATWQFVSVLVDETDAAALGASGPQGGTLGAPDLYQANGHTYLLVTPNGPVPFGNGYRGCLDLELSDVDAGVVARCGGVPEVRFAYSGLNGIFTGPCTAAPGSTATGVLVPMAFFLPALSFHIYASHDGPP
jgi:hypothetical protein